MGGELASLDELLRPFAVHAGEQHLAEGAVHRAVAAADGDSNVHVTGRVEALDYLGLVLVDPLGDGEGEVLPGGERLQAVHGRAHQLDLPRCRRSEGDQGRAEVVDPAVRILAHEPAGFEGGEQVVERALGEPGGADQLGLGRARVTETAELVEDLDRPHNRRHLVLAHGAAYSGRALKRRKTIVFSRVSSSSV